VPHPNQHAYRYGDIHHDAHNYRDTRDEHGGDCRDYDHRYDDARGYGHAGYGHAGYWNTSSDGDHDASDDGDHDARDYRHAGYWNTSDDQHAPGDGCFPLPACLRDRVGKPRIQQDHRQSAGAAHQQLRPDLWPGD